MRLLKFGPALQVFFCCAAAAACTALWLSGIKPATLATLCATTAVAWAGMLLVTLPQAKFPPGLLASPGSFVHMLFAGVALVCAWAVVVAGKRESALFVLTLMLLVWVADVGAYFSGKTFGKRKLAINISPGKTWEGAIGGALLVCVLAVGLSFVAGTFFVKLGNGSLMKVVLLSAVLAAVSVMGDLFESLLKRQAGAKDSSNLLPGHGGVFDRIDALLPMLPLAWLLL
jgi:phosphatidate cytidylyltransferase